MAKQKQPESDPSKKEEPADAGDRLRDYAKYSGMAFQMGIIILVGTFLGKKLDEHFQLERPYLTVLLALLSISAALYLVLKDLSFTQQEDDDAD